MLLSIKNLSVLVSGTSGEKAIVSDLSLDVAERSIVALVGGSGSGKTTTGLAVLRLLPPELQLRGGPILWEGRNVLQFSQERMRALRGKEMAMVFQEPLNAFNPVFKIGRQIDEVLKYHTPLTAPQRRDKTFEWFKTVGLGDPKRVYESYPHQLSGGMRQRAMIAQAIALHPKLVIADEPTSSLDVTLQARIIELFQKLRDELKLSILLITHDLGVVKHLSDEVIVLSGGKIVEAGKTKTVLSEPRQDYTRQLLAAV